MGRRVPGYSWESAGRPPVAGAFQAAPGCSGACSVAPGFLLNGSAPKGSAPKNRRHRPPASAPAGTVPPPAEEAEARTPESAVPEPVELRQPDLAGSSGTAPGSGMLQIPGSAQDSVPAAECYCRAVPASAGSASGSSPRPVFADWAPAEEAQTAKATAERVPAEAAFADSSPDSAAVATPAA